jgi:UDP-N-acetylmuramate dehydrogenase
VTRLADYTTLGLGGPAKAFVTAASESELIQALRAADTAGEPVLVIGGGSNLVIADAGFPGTVVHVNSRGISYSAGPSDTGHAVDTTVAAGEDWDDVVAATLAEGLSGLECLSGIPGRAGATPVQNVGAYGHEVAEVITQVRVYDRQENETRVMRNGECSFAYRTSLFKSGRPESLVSAGGGVPHRAVGAARYVVLDVTFRLTRQQWSLPVTYAELARELGVPMGEQAAAADVRAAVLKIRARKGMVLNPGDPDTRSAGSFFTNPVITQAEFARILATAEQQSGDGRVPHFPAPGDLIKVPAAWLIEHSGFAKGYGTPGKARLSSKHTLALTNAGDATTTDLIALAREIVAGVRVTFGVTLEPEPILLGVTL